MIKYDYTLVRNEKNEIVTYTPNLLPAEFDNVVYLQGPNSSGKSTILNLIAVAFFGNKLSADEIDPALLNKIKYLLNLDHQKLVFDIRIDNQDIGISLISQKQNLENSDITVKKVSNGEEIILNSVSFFKEFKLIYDIPHSPLERLPQLFNEVKATQNDIGTRISDFREHLRYLNDEIRNSRDPKMLADLKNKLQRLELEEKDLENGAKRFTSLAKKVISYAFSKIYLDNHKAALAENAKLSEVIKKIEKVEKGKRRGAQVNKLLVKQVSEDIATCQNYHQKSYQLLARVYKNKDKVHFDLWKQSDLSNELHHPEVYKTLRNESKHFVEVIKDTLDFENINSKKEIEAVELYKLLLSTLTRYKGSDITLPGINQTVEAFLSIITEEVRNHEALLAKLADLNQCMVTLEGLIKYMEKAINSIKQLKAADTSTSSFDGIEYQALLTEKKHIQGLIKNFEVKRDAAREQLIKHNIDPSDINNVYEKMKADSDIQPFTSESGDDLLRRIEEIIQTIKQKNDQLTRIRRAIDNKKTDIALMEKRKPHEYKKYQDILEYYYQKTLRLEQRFKKQYSDYIDRVIKHDSRFGRLSDDEKLYIDQLGKFLASKIHVLKHIDNEYVVKNIRILEEKIITDSEKEIFFSDLGSGQGQAAFLTAKLALNDNKKIIALFDEVAMIDEQNLKPVKDKLRELYNEKRLFMAIIVQKNDTVKVESLL